MARIIENFEVFTVVDGTECYAKFEKCTHTNAYSANDAGCSIRIVRKGKVWRMLVIEVNGFAKVVSAHNLPTLRKAIEEGAGVLAGYQLQAKAWAE